MGDGGGPGISLCAATKKGPTGSPRRPFLPLPSPPAHGLNWWAAGGSYSCKRGATWFSLLFNTSISIPQYPPDPPDPPGSPLNIAAVKVFPRRHGFNFSDTCSSCGRHWHKSIACLKGDGMKGKNLPFKIQRLVFRSRTKNPFVGHGNSVRNLLAAMDVKFIDDMPAAGL